MRRAIARDAAVAGFGDRDDPALTRPPCAAWRFHDRRFTLVSAVFCLAVLASSQQHRRSVLRCRFDRLPRSAGAEFVQFIAGPVAKGLALAAVAHPPIITGS